MRDSRPIEAWADGSSWAEVIPRLQADGLKVTAYRIRCPRWRITLLRHATHWRRRMDRPCGHSWGGTVISEVGTDPKVTSLAYVATGAPEANEDLVALFAKFPNGEARAGIQTNDGYIQLSEDTLPMASTAKRQKSSRQNRDPTADRLSPGEPLRLRCTRSRPGTRWRNSTRRSIPILKAGVEQASPSTPQRKSFHAQHHCKSTCRYNLVRPVECSPRRRATARTIANPRNHRKRRRQQPHCRYA